MMDGNAKFRGNGWLRPLLVWCVLVVLAGAALAAYQRMVLVAELERQSATLHRLASQQADQHDAHMTALSAIAVAGDGRSFDLFLEVAATITRFYPRIVAVQLVSLDGQAETVGTGPLAPALAEEIRAAAGAADGGIVLLPDRDLPDHYRMIKRSPNNVAARYGLTLRIDAGKLVADAGPFWSQPGVDMRLLLPEGGILVGSETLPVSARYENTLGSASQPLRLQTGMDIGFADLLPASRVLLTLLGVSLLFLAGLAVMRQRARARRAMQQVRLSAMETRLTHASRVNALGELASGLVHELTQPLTAILAQAQAGRRFLSRGDHAALVPVLDDTVAQARRASDILKRFRDWSRPQQAPVAPFDLRDAIRNVRALLEQASAAQAVRFDLHLPGEPVIVSADAVEMEQVVFNLMRNAIEALEGQEGARRVTVALTRDAADATLDIADNGPGVPQALRERLFSPFTTTRPGGTGLGLALSQRLVERAGGEISLLDGTAGATFRVVLPLAGAMREAAQ